MGYRHMKKEFLTTVFIRARERLLRRAAAIVDSDAEAQDLVQEAFCRLWSSPRQPGDESAAEALALTAVRNAGIDALRSRARHRETPVEDAEAELGEEPSSDSEADETFSRVSHIIDLSVSPRDRDIFFRRERDGWEYSEIAGHFSISESNARQIVARTRRTVRDTYLKLYRR